jgi:hypothetical protein
MPEFPAHDPDLELAALVADSYAKLSGSPAEQAKPSVDNVAELYASVPTSKALERFDQLQAARGRTADAFAGIPPRQLVPLFNPLSAPCRGMFSALDPSALEPGQFSLIQDLRFDDGSLKARQPTTDRSATGLPTNSSNSAFPNTTGMVRGIWSGKLNGTTYVLVACWDGTANVRLYYSTNGIAFTEATAASGAYGNTRMTDTGTPFRFVTVYEQVSQQDVLVIQNDVDQPRLFTTAAHNGAYVRTVDPITAPSAAGNYATSPSPPCNLPIFSSAYAYGSTSKPYTVASSAGSLVPANALNGGMLFTSLATGGTDALSLTWSSAASFASATQLCFLLQWTGSATPNLLANYKIQIVDSVGGAQTVYDPASTTTQNLSYEVQPASSSTSAINGGLPATANLVTFDLTPIAAANRSHVTGINIGADSGSQNLTLQADWGIVAIFGGASTGAGSLYGTSPVDLADSSYSIAFYNSGTFTESPGVVVQTGTSTTPTISALGGYNYLPGWDQTLPAFQFTQFQWSVPYFNPSSSDLANGVDTLNVYRMDEGSSDYLFAFSVGLATWSGSAWGLVNSTTSVQYAPDTVNYLSLAIARYSPDAYNISMPVGGALCWANSRLFVGGTGFYYASEFGFPFRFRLVLEIENNAPVSRSGTWVQLAGQTVQAFATPSGAALASATVFFWTETKCYALSGFDGYSLSQPSTVMEVGCSAPGSVAQYKDAIFFLDDNQELRRFSYGRAFLYGYSNSYAYDLAHAISKRVVDDQTRGIPAGRLPWVQGCATFDRYYMAYSTAGTTQNGYVLVWDETIGAFVQDSLPAGAESCCYSLLSSGRSMLLAGSNGHVYTHEDPSSAAAHTVALSTGMLHDKGWSPKFFGRVGLVMDVQSGQSATVTRTLRPVGTESTSIDLHTLPANQSSVNQQWRWDTLATSTQPGVSGVACQIGLSWTMTPGTKLYALVIEIQEALAGADQL